ncbi:hypothetical protein E2C01_039713 [Portunus trituberculatus]|uniref:Uncharacterized protein n=1 Tax=Portunus trituberculatus TaxID=210409 RepID=A0A5B7FKJ2_PORTR|nr:hypothetical protein [Portunus trituberculatus]
MTILCLITDLVHSARVPRQGAPGRLSTPLVSTVLPLIPPPPHPLPFTLLPYHSSHPTTYQPNLSYSLFTIPQPIHSDSTPAATTIPHRHSFR